MENELPNSSESRLPLRVRFGLGAGIVLVLILAGTAVIASALSSHGATATAVRPAGHSVHTEGPSTVESPEDYVHVVGQVVSPGLYRLAAGSRVVDAIAAAGGFTPIADQSQLNLAQVIEDGQQIEVVAQGAVPAAATSGGSVAGGTVDINTADATALETLDGIGPALAQRILAYRSAHGGFRTVNDLQNVTGIGPKKFAAIKAGVRT